MPNIQHKRGTRAALDALAASSGLVPWQVYAISDESRLALALTASTYQTFLKTGEASGGGVGYYVGPTAPDPATYPLWFNTTAGAFLVYVSGAWVEPGATLDPDDFVPRAGGVTMTGPLSVPAGASGAQVPQAQEVYLSTAVEISTASGSSVDITGIPTNWNEIHLHFKGTFHTGPLEILVGDSTGYAGWVYDTVNSAVTSTGTLGVGRKTNAIGVRSIAGGAYLSGVIVFYRISLAEWGFSGTLSGTGDDTRTIWVGGRTRDSNNTDQLNSFRLVPAGAFTGGSVLIRGRK